MNSRTATDRQRPRSTAKRMIIMLILVGVVFGLIFGFKAWLSGFIDEMIASMPQPPAAITEAAVVEDRWAGVLDAVGTLVAVNGTDVTTESPGVVSAIRFESGQPVRKGDVLVQLDASAETASLNAMEAGLNLAVTQRDRFRELYSSRQAVAKADLDERESVAEQLQAEVDAQRALIARKTIRAPFDGVLGIRRINLGQYLNPGDAIVNLQSLDPIYVNFSLPEQQLDAAHVGQTITASVDALPGERFQGAVTAIEPQVDAGTRNFLVQATIANPEHTLRAGTFARVSAEIGVPEPVLVVPQTAISFNPYGNSVYVISEQPPAEGQGEPELTVRQRFVRTGATRGDMIAIVEGLQAGDRVATSGLLKLRNDATVIINDAVQPSSDLDPTPDNS